MNALFDLKRAMLLNQQRDIKERRKELKVVRLTLSVILKYWALSVYLSLFKVYCVVLLG